MIPALAFESLFVCETTSALTVPSPVSDCESKWNWSEVPVMSEPPP
jgi:hypothetical protein